MSQALGWILSQNGISGRSFPRKYRINVQSSSHLTGKLNAGTFRSIGRHGSRMMGGKR